LRKQSSAPFLTLPSLIGAKVSRVASGYCTVRTSGTGSRRARHAVECQNKDGHHVIIIVAVTSLARILLTTTR
jgi:hypothetical protein